MSRRATDWAMSLPTRSPSRPEGLTASERYLMIELADHHNASTGRCDPSLARLADRTGLSTATVKRTLTALEDRGLIARERSNGAHRTRYALALPAEAVDNPPAEAETLAHESTTLAHHEPGPGSPRATNQERTKRKTNHARERSPEHPTGVRADGMDIPSSPPPTRLRERAEALTTRALVNFPPMTTAGPALIAKMNREHVEMLAQAERRWPGASEGALDSWAYSARARSAGLCPMGPSVALVQRLDDETHRANLGAPLTTTPNDAAALVGAGMRRGADGQHTSD